MSLACVILSCLLWSRESGLCPLGKASDGPRNGAEPRVARGTVGRRIFRLTFRCLEAQLVLKGFLFRGESIEQITLTFDVYTYEN
jgi:hypothetical protein